MPRRMHFTAPGRPRASLIVPLERADERRVRHASERECTPSCADNYKCLRALRKIYYYDTNLRGIVDEATADVTGCDG
jgi:hypothetical protein